MSDYVEIYKRYRPNQWNKVIGQDKTVRSIKAALKSDKIPTAYGLFGPRGSGKTTIALLLAKAVNCDNLDKDFNPCNECPSCVSIDDNTNPDVVYESMANNGSVEYARKLMDSSTFTPMYKKKVFILDEVHSLSKAALAAILVPMEDKNNKALFILCSTEADKIPEANLSRIQSRNINLVNEDEMTSLVNRIVEEEDGEISEKSISDIVRRGRGSVRDTLTILEAVLLDEDDEDFVDHSADLLESIAEHDLPKALSTVSLAIKDGDDAMSIAEQLHSDLRDLIILSSGADESLAPEFPLEDYNDVLKGMKGVNGAIFVFKTVGESINKMGINSDSRPLLEIALTTAILRLKASKK